MFIFAIGFIIQFGHASHHYEEIMERAINNLSGTFRNIINQADVCSEIIIVAQELAEKPNTNTPFVMKTSSGTALDDQYQEQQQKRRENRKNFYMAEFMIRGIEVEKERISKTLSPNDKKKADDFLSSTK